MTSENYVKALIFLFATVFMQPMLTLPIQAQTKDAENTKSEVIRKPPSKTELYRRKVNNGTLSIMSGGITGTYLHIATDLASVLDNDGSPRIRLLPIAGKGGVRNIEDLMYLRGVDMAIVQSDVLSYIESRKLFSNVRKRIQYITKLYDSELHILANKSIKDIRELDGKTVSLWHEGSATDITGKNLFRFLNINPKIVYMDNKLGIEKTQKGEIAATFLVVGKPVKYYQKLLSVTGLHFLPVKYEGKLVEDYLPSKFSHKDYPNLIAKDQTISTLSTSAVLVVYRRSKDSWRYKKVARFVDSFFENIGQFRKTPRHPKWRDISIAAKLPGWSRFPHAEEWLAKQQAKTKLAITSSTSNTPSINRNGDFSSFLQNSGITNKPLQSMSPQEQEVLFQKYLDWQKSKQK